MSLFRFGIGSGMPLEFGFNKGTSFVEDTVVRSKFRLSGQNRLASVKPVILQGPRIFLSGVLCVGKSGRNLEDFTS
jgi:hypothetical protein